MRLLMSGSRDSCQTSSWSLVAVGDVDEVTTTRSVSTRWQTTLNDSDWLGPNFHDALLARALEGQGNAWCA